MTDACVNSRKESQKNQTHLTFTGIEIIWSCEQVNPLDHHKSARLSFENAIETYF